MNGHVTRLNGKCYSGLAWRKIPYGKDMDKRSEKILRLLGQHGPTYKNQITRLIALLDPGQASAPTISDRIKKLKEDGYIQVVSHSERRGRGPRPSEYYRLTPLGLGSLIHGLANTEEGRQFLSVLMQRHRDWNPELCNIWSEIHRFGLDEQTLMMFQTFFYGHPDFPLHQERQLYEAGENEHPKSTDSILGQVGGRPDPLQSVLVHHLLQEEPLWMQAVEASQILRQAAMGEFRRGLQDLMKMRDGFDGDIKKYAVILERLERGQGTFGQRLRSGIRSAFLGRND